MNQALHDFSLFLPSETLVTVAVCFCIFRLHRNAKTK